MKKNFDKPFSRFYDEPDVDSAWHGMLRILDQQLPVSKPDRYKRTVIYIISVAAMLLATLVIMVPQKISNTKGPESKIVSTNRDHSNLVSPEQKQIDHGFAPGKQDDQKRGATVNTAAPASTHSYDSAKKDAAVVSADLSLKGYYINQARPFKPLINSRKTEARKVIDQQLILKLDLPNSILPPVNFLTEKATLDQVEIRGRMINISPVKDSAVLPLSAVTIKDSKERQLKKIGVQVGLSHNVGASWRAISPVVAITKRLSRKSFLSVAVGFNSQLTTNGFTPIEFVVLHDSSGQPYFDVAETNIRKLVYIDIPLYLKYAINKNFNLTAGVKLSLLQHSDVSTKEERFEALANLPPQLSNFPLITTSSLVLNQSYAQHYQIMKTNGRLIAGVEYRVNDVGITLQYEKSFSSNYRLTDFNGTQFRKRLSLLSVGLNYRLR